MFFNLLYPLSDSIGIFNVFQYLTFRTGAAVVTGLLISFAFGPALIRALRARQTLGQPIRADRARDPRGQGGDADHGRGVDPARRHRSDAALGRHDQPAHLGTAGDHDRVRCHRLHRRRDEASESQPPRTEHPHQGRRRAGACAGSRLLGHDDSGGAARSRPRAAVREVAADRHPAGSRCPSPSSSSSARPMPST